MIRYLVLSNVWLAVGLAVLLGRGPDPRPGYFTSLSTVFGMGLMEPWVFWSVVGTIFGLAVLFGFLYWRSKPRRAQHVLARRGFEVVTSHGGHPAT